MAKDYLETLALKSLGLARAISPRPVSPFEPPANAIRVLPAPLPASEPADRQPSVEGAVGDDLLPSSSPMGAADRPTRQAPSAPVSGVVQQTRAAGRDDVSSVLSADERPAVPAIRRPESPPVEVGQTLAMLEIGAAPGPTKLQQAIRPAASPAQPGASQLLPAPPVPLPTEESTPDRLTSRSAERAERVLRPASQLTAKQESIESVVRSDDDADHRGVSPVKPARAPQEEERPAQAQPLKPLPVIARPHREALVEPALPQAASAGAAIQAQTTVQVTIGRIEVRATPAAAALPRKQTPATPMLSLDEYLRQRTGGGR